MRGWRGEDGRLRSSTSFSRGSGWLGVLYRPGLPAEVGYCERRGIPRGIPMSSRPAWWLVYPKTYCTAPAAVQVWRAGCGIR